MKSKKEGGSRLTLEDQKRLLKLPLNRCFTEFELSEAYNREFKKADMKERRFLSDAFLFLKDLALHKVRRSNGMLRDTVLDNYSKEFKETQMTSEVLNPAIDLEAANRIKGEKPVKPKPEKPNLPSASSVPGKVLSVFNEKPSDVSILTISRAIKESVADTYKAIGTLKRVNAIKITETSPKKTKKENRTFILTSKVKNSEANKKKLKADIKSILTFLKRNNMLRSRLMELTSLSESQITEYISIIQKSITNRDNGTKIIVEEFGEDLKYSLVKEKEVEKVVVPEKKKPKYLNDDLKPALKQLFLDNVGKSLNIIQIQAFLKELKLDFVETDKMIYLTIGELIDSGMSIEKSRPGNVQHYQYLTGVKNTDRRQSFGLTPEPVLSALKMAKKSLSAIMISTKITGMCNDIMIKHVQNSIYLLKKKGHNIESVPGDRPSTVHYIYIPPVTGTVDDVEKKFPNTIIKLQKPAAKVKVIEPERKKLDVAILPEMFDRVIDQLTTYQENGGIQDRELGTVTGIDFEDIPIIISTLREQGLVITESFKANSLGNWYNLVSTPGILEKSEDLSLTGYEKVLEVMEKGTNPLLITSILKRLGAKESAGTKSAVHASLQYLKDTGHDIRSVAAADGIRVKYYLKREKRVIDYAVNKESQVTKPTGSSKPPPIKRLVKSKAISTNFDPTETELLAAEKEKPEMAETKKRDKTIDNKLMRMCHGYIESHDNGIDVEEIAKRFDISVEQATELIYAVCSKYDDLYFSLYVGVKEDCDEE